jgi:hypothetical protein
VSHVAVPSLLDGIVVDVNDPVQVSHDDLGNFMKLMEVIHPLVVVDEGWQCKRSQVANGDLIGSRVLDDFRA